MARFSSHLGRRRHNDSPGWFRSFTYPAEYTRAGNFTKIIYLESDAFVISRRLERYINQLQAGWVTLWSPFHRIPEDNIQIIVGDSLESYYEFAKIRYTDFSTQVDMERQYPSMIVENRFIGDRYGEYRADVPPFAEFATQTWQSVDRRLHDLWWLARKRGDEIAKVALPVDLDATADLFNLTLLTETQRYVWLHRAELRDGAAVTNPARIRDFLCWWYIRGGGEQIRPPAKQYAALAASAFAASALAPPISRYLVHLWYERSDLAAVYPLATPAGRRGFIEWLLSFGRAELSIEPWWIDQALRDWLLAPDPQMPPAPRLALDLWRARPDLRQAFDPGQSHAAGHGLRDWFWEHGMIEHQLGWMIDP
jgi:hypothetical protein